MADADDPGNQPSTSKPGAPVLFKRGRAGKRRARTAADDDDDAATVIKQAKPELKGAIQVTNASAAKQDDEMFRGKGELQSYGDGGAARVLEENTEHDRDGRALKEAAMADAGEDDGKYKGMKGYKDWRGVRLSIICLGELVLHHMQPAHAVGFVHTEN